MSELSRLEHLASWVSKVHSIARFNCKIVDHFEMLLDMPVTQHWSTYKVGAQSDILLSMT